VEVVLESTLPKSHR